MSKKIVSFTEIDGWANNPYGGSEVKDIVICTADGWMWRWMYIWDEEKQCNNREWVEYTPDWYVDWSKKVMEVETK